MFWFVFMVHAFKKEEEKIRRGVKGFHTKDFSVLEKHVRCKLTEESHVIATCYILQFSP